jgi:Pyruvate/2-oxoacid:ferredoxin oxidoreductase delta subunit
MPALIVLCHCEDENRISALAGKCVEAGFRIVLAPSLYHIPEKSPLWEQLAGLGPISAIWSSLHPRPAKWLLHRHSLQAAAYRYEAYNSAGDCFEAMKLHPDLPPAVMDGNANSLPADNSIGIQVFRWHPVVDKERCDNCGQCLQFCLFGVYARDEAQHVIASKPDACKTGCPACSRICPKGAIMFPLYIQDPAISGAPGLFMFPDKSARRMFYMRVKQACPVCKTIPSGPASNKEDACPECGSPCVQPKSPIQDDIDTLIDALDGKP